MPSLAKRERLLYADLLESAGPDAPTLCEGWRTRDLAAHSVIRERRPDAAGGVLIKALAPRLERTMGDFTAKPYEELLQLVRTGPPRFSPMAFKQVDEAVNTVEFYVHAEDVRRAQPGWTPRTVDPVLADTLWARLERSARIFGRRSPAGLVLRRPDGRTAVARRGAPVVTVTGEPGELTMFLFGRQDIADVTLEGDQDAVEKVRGSKELGL